MTPHVVFEWATHRLAIPADQVSRFEEDVAGGGTVICMADGRRWTVTGGVKLCPLPAPMPLPELLRGWAEGVGVLGLAIGEAGMVFVLTPTWSGGQA